MLKRTAYAESGLVADISDVVKMDEEQMKKTLNLHLNKKVAKTKALKKYKTLTVAIKRTRLTKP